MPFKTTNAGFTLIEMIVVICIISILAAAAVVGVMSALESGKVSQTQTLITQLSASIEAFEADHGYYPAPAFDFSGTGLADPDYTNTGIECCLLTLRQDSGNGPYFDVTAFADRLANTDGDDMIDGYTYFGITAQRTDNFELADPWGNPLIYITERYYEDPDLVPLQVWDRDGNIIDVTPQPVAATGTFPQSYMIWSFGPNGVNDNGEGDDIVSWGKVKP